MKPETGTKDLLIEHNFKPIGQFKPRHARDIEASPWSVGSETLDRYFVDFAQTGPHLGELGAKEVRLQAGWARCEPEPGKYDWQWLDDIVNSCVEQGVTPWLETSYGNPGYEGGGESGLAGGLPKSEEALAAWDRWVSALATRYQDRVSSWEIWNEPDIGSDTPECYNALFIRTAKAIRAVQPDANIIAFGLAGKIEYVETLLTELKAKGLTELINQITFHFYPHNPDESFERVDKIKQIVQEHAPHVTLRQGETGCPSETRQFLALGNFEWSERKQAAWDLRRLLAHNVRGIPMSLFQLADMQYSKQTGRFDGRNSKGLLCINPDKTVAYRKPAYFMAQHVFSLFDNRFPLKALDNLLSGTDENVQAYSWHLKGQPTPSVVAWWNASTPPELATASLETISIPAQDVADPVLFDFLSGSFFELPDCSSALWTSLPCTDVPLAIISRSLVSN